jgi:purine-nucleoside phosphorylase
VQLLPHRGELGNLAVDRSQVVAGILAIEMEAAALYTFARIVGVRVLCLAHVTNTMGQAGDDFEKGEADGTHDAFAALDTVIAGLQSVD